jgi:polyhydroxyalkanoate synthase
MKDASERMPRTEEIAAESIAGANPFVGLTPRQVANALGRWAGKTVRSPRVPLEALANLSREQVRVVRGTSKIAADPKDRRFSNPAWSGPLWGRLTQSYLATRRELLGTVDALDLDAKSKDRARFALMQVTEAIAPSNNLITNPVAINRAVETRGRSLVDGARHLAWDVRHNGGLPSQVDSRPFEVGKTLAVTPGAVVHRCEMFELLQYAPTTAKVHSRPTVVIPPQVNKYYFLDLAPGRSFVEHAVAQGLQVFMISWRNPGPEQRDWSLDDYAAACLEALEVAAAISRSPDVNVTGFCAGGMTQAALVSHLAATGRKLVHSNTLAVTTIDTQAKSVMTMFVSERSAAAAIEGSARKGVLEGRSLARVFAWVRPNDLVWNYWVANYLMGETPPAFDVLAWNADATNLPAALHADFVHLFVENSLLEPGKLDVLGTPVDLRRVETDLYVLAASNDHLVPWQAAYAATASFGGATRFVLSNSGHIQALINPPGNPKATYFVNDDYPAEPGEWLADAESHQGSWWTDWAEWIAPRSGPLRAARRKLGNAQHPPMENAPGTYVHQR